ncbi:ATP-binding cassette domain-containing protein [Puniceibacterium sediminis]|uniref:Thiamine transport system ATP-binding protein n=1 Tax=Puniceibacterium sediminis TaxID=1608407 RepID=A0A238WNQ5_9RHOB|nr:ATP-binding cassette domain-containing protein [Puniceibacterium sediminis]SNR48230.1 thiamine transport system ATP-binding protein [Puniceibacterium sediminis]
MLRLEGVQVIEGDFTLSADFELRPGERIAVIGPSGAGKSTLLDVIAGFRVPEAGRVLWGGQDLTAVVPGRRPVGMLFQDNNLFPHLSVERNLGLALRPGGGRLSPAEDARVAEALSRVGLEGLGARRPGALSGGQQSRAALARVLVQDRPVMLLDEPFAALGPALKAGMLDLVAEVAGAVGALVVLVTHDPEDARRFAQRVVLVADGVAAAPVETEALFADPPEALRAYLG